MSLLVHTGLRIDEALSRDLNHWRRDASHDVLDLKRKGVRDTVTVQPAPVVRALYTMLAERRADPPPSGDSRTAARPGRRARRAGAVVPHALRHAPGCGH